LADNARTFAEVEQWVEGWSFDRAAPLGAAAPRQLLAAAEEILGLWLVAHGKAPSSRKVEEFTLLGLHRQAAKGDPSFNACRETCREVCYRFNLAATDLAPAEWRANLATLRRVVQHLVYFVGGKMRNAQIGEFCCSSRSLRTDEAEAGLGVG